MCVLAVPNCSKHALTSTSPATPIDSTCDSTGNNCISTYVPNSASAVT